MPANAQATLGAKTPPEGMVLTSKAGIASLHTQKS